MNFDDIQKAWKEQQVTKIYSIDEEALHKSVKRKSRNFDIIVTIRDILEFIAPIGLVFILVYHGVVFFPEEVGGTWHDYWYLYLFSIPILFATVYFFRGRRQEKQKIGQYEDTILGEVKKAIYRIDKQIQVSKNLFLWNIMPGMAGIFPVLYFLSLLTFKSGDPVLPVNLWFLFALITFLILLQLWVYRYITQNKLIPQKKVYEELREKLVSES